jgi:hypothetical protein
VYGRKQTPQSPSRSKDEKVVDKEAFDGILGDTVKALTVVKGFIGAFERPTGILYSCD